MRIEILSIGDEILKGMVVNSNAAFISRALYEKGYAVAKHSAVSDEPDLLDKELRSALARSSLVITTGGLGPTLDDRTRHVAAGLFSSDFTYNQTVADDLMRRYGSKLTSLTDQATIPTKAEPLLNPVGTAPGLVFTNGAKTLILLPGVPIEMEALFTEQVLPLVQTRYQLSEKKEHIQLHLCLVVESQIDPLLRECTKRYPAVDVGIYPALGMVSVHLASAQKEQLRAFQEALRKQFHTHIFPSTEGKIQEALQQWFCSHRKLLSVAESCTGGAIASQITSFPGASAYFLGSLVTYCDAWKVNLLHVKSATLQNHGAVSAEIVTEMLHGLFAMSTADFGIAVSGIAGPSGGSSEKPVGTIWAAIGERGQPFDVGQFTLTGSRQKIISVSSQYLLGALWRKVAHHIPAFNRHA